MSFGFGFGVPSQASASGGATLNLNFIGSTTLDPKITFTRASTATYTDSAGLIASAAINAPRFDYDPVTLQPKGLLIEEQRTNLLTYSEQFDNAAWFVNGTPTITANVVVAPDGTTTADTLDVSGASNGYGVYRNVVSSGTFASSLYFKLMSGAFTLRVGLTGNYSEINCATLAITNTGTGVGTVTSVGNGWYRFVSVGTISVLSASMIYNIGSNTGTLAIWGAQLEAGAFATSYIPTVAAQVTRAADNAVMTGTNFSSWFNATEGSFAAVFDMNAAPLGTGNKGVYCAYLNGSNNIVSYAANSTGNLADVVADGGVSQAAYTSVAVLAANTVYKDAFAYKLNDFARSLNAATVQTDTSGTVPAGLTEFRIGRDDTGSPTLNGHIRSITYWPRRLSNGELQAVTA